MQRTGSLYKKYRWIWDCRDKRRFSSSTTPDQSEARIKINNDDFQKLDLTAFKTDNTESNDKAETDEACKNCQSTHMSTHENILVASENSQSEDDIDFGFSDKSDDDEGYHILVKTVK